MVKATQLRQQWKSRNFSQIPPIEVLSDEVLGTANGAYSSSKNKIYLSASFLNTASSASIINVILEEIGHYVDAQINQVDSAGDEGAIFSELVQGNSIDVGTLQVLQAEDDSGTIHLNGQIITVEQSTNNLQTATGDGGLVVTVDEFGRFGSNSVGGQSAFYDPIGSKPSSSTTYSSFVALGIITNGSTGARTQLEPSASNNEVFTSVNSTNANSTFTIGGLQFQLKQTVQDTFNNTANRTGGRLDQTYTITNSTTQTINFDLVRYVDGDLNFDGSISDGGGRIVQNGQEILFETDAGGIGQTDTTFFGISDIGGTIPTTNRWELDGYSSLRSNVLAGNTLRNTIVEGDSNSDQFIDAGSEYDVALALRNVFSLAPGQSTTYTTITRFGSGEAAQLDITPPTGGVGSLPATTVGNNINVTWSATDPSGIRDYDVFVSVNGGSFAQWQTNVTTTSAVYTGEVGKTYTFYSLATDNAGNEQSATTAPRTSTQVINPITLAISPISVNEDGTPNLVYTFTRSGNLSTSLTTNFSVGGTATFNTDYTQTGAASFTTTTGTVTFAANSTTATVTVNPTADTTVESDETVILTLASGTGYTVGTTTPVTGTINDDEPPIINLAVSPASVTEDGTTNLIYTFTRSGLTTNSLTVNYTLGGTATLNTDYTRTGTNNTVTFAAGSSTATVTVDPTADTTVEPNETVILTLAAGTGYTVGTPNAATGTITNDDTSVTLAVSPSSVTEDGTTNLVYTFTRTGSTTSALTANYTVGGTATNGTDYTSIPTSVTFAANSATATVTVDPTPDTTVEPDETVILTLAAGTGYTVGTPNAATGTITNDDTSVTLAVSPSSVTEDGTTNLVYTFTRTGVTTNALTVNYTLGGTATLNTDYTRTGTTNTVTFAANSPTATVTVDPTADTIVESNETVILTLAAGTGYTVGTPNAATGTITNDDTSVTLAVSPSSVTEDGTTNLVYTFTRTGVTTNALTVNYTLGGTATLNTDYTRTGTTNTVTFAANSPTATVTVDPTADTIVEPDETVILTLATGTGYTVGTPNAATGTITNGIVTPSITLAVSPSSVTEDGTTNLVYTFTRSGVTTDALTVNYTVEGTATNGTDYTSIPTSVTFAANATTATVTVDPTADTTVEPDETVILTLASGTGYTVGTPNAATGTINNDDTRVTLAVSPASVTEDGTTNLVYTFTRTGVTTNALTVNYTLGGTATLNTDYTRTGTTNTVTFAANSPTATVTVDPTADTIVESNETVILTLAAGTGYTIGTTTPVTGTINNDDSASISINDVTVSEGNSGTTNAVFTVTLSNPVDTSVTLNYSTANGTATTADNDYTAIATTPLTFNVGETSKTITVAVNGDTKVENNETFFLNLSNLQANGRNVTITDNQGQGTINDDDSTVTSQLSINDITVVEGQNSNAILTVTVNNPSTQQITVNYTTAPIDATANVDYTSQTGTLTIAANTATATISIPILNDNLNEPDEAFTVTLSNAVNATINPDEAIGQVIITDTLQSSITRTLPNNVENLRLIGSNNINGTGNTGDNKITGNSGNNILAGANGNDIYCFNASTPLGSDTIQETTTGGIDTLDFTGTNTAVRVNLGTTAVQTVVTNNLRLTFSANNTIENIISDSGNDRLTGNSLNNTLTGGGGNDQLTGQNGNDSLIGGFGDDLLTGGNGSDNFIFNSSNLGIDAISDFTPGSDKIVLSKAIFTALQSIIGNGFSQPAEFASVDDDDLVAISSAFIVYSTSSGSIYYNQNGSAAGLGSGSEFANLLTVPTLIAADFTLIN
ncbi:MAG: hypothetical protein DWQ54_00415 [Microcystis flos-aquae TF09]|uniref:Calx-beta domain-containing protein n=1 Tax=Microcystis flos-aquae TF09 TaxID=2060473 RepID=A0A3E0L9H1_9CHRO|nr:MAG: hypothetical protein DWQ54_00415 [Microcystis flos-aquae TF09]